MTAEDAHALEKLLECLDFLFETQGISVNAGYVQFRSGMTLSYLSRSADGKYEAGDY